MLKKIWMFAITALVSLFLTIWFQASQQKQSVTIIDNNTEQINSDLRSTLGIKTYGSNQTNRIVFEQEDRKVLKKRQEKIFLQWGKYIKISSILFSVLGGIILAKKSKISGYGFIFLALSSSQLLVSSLLLRDIASSIYAISVFGFVDLLGIYNWLLAE